MSDPLPGVRIFKKASPEDRRDEKPSTDDVE